MKHLDLFSGIGGFAYAVDQVWPGSTHTFCDNDPFCQKVLAKHWPESEIYDDIRQLITDPRRSGGNAGCTEKAHGQASKRSIPAEENQRFGRIDILTGGFPCQPFSAAGLRRGTSDERHLWPEMLRIIRLTKPEWVIAENVRGILTWNEGMVFEQVCVDLEASGYEVQPFIIPAVAVNAPHRRDRVWFVAHANSNRSQKSGARQQTGRDRQFDETTADHPSKGLEGGRKQRPRQYRQPDRIQQRKGPSWNENWLEVAAQFCGVDDGLPAELDGFKLTKSAHRKEQLKAYGNAIVPQVAMEIMKGMAI